MAEAKKDVTPKGDQLPAEYDYGEYSNQGYEGTDSGDVVIPFIGVLQGLSPIVEERDDCKPGMLFNTVTEEVYPGDEGITFIPAVVGMKEYVEWVPRDAGGGLVARHGYDSPTVLAAIEKAREDGLPFGRNGRPLASMKVPNGKGGSNDLIETKYIYGVDAEDGSLLCIAFTSTKMKAFNNFYTRISTVRGNPPPFAFLVRLTSFADENPKGKFHNFKLSGAVEGNFKKSLLPPTDERFQAAKDLYDMVKAGEAQAAFESQEKAGATVESVEGDAF